MPVSHQRPANFALVVCSLNVVIADSNRPTNQDRPCPGSHVLVLVKRRVKEPEVVPSTRIWIVDLKKNIMGYYSTTRSKDNFVMSTSSSHSEPMRLFFSGSVPFGRRAQQHSAVGHVGPLTLAWRNPRWLRARRQVAYSWAPVQQPSRRNGDESVILHVRIFRIRSLAIPNLRGLPWIASASKIHSPVSGTSHNEIHPEKKSHRRLNDLKPADDNCTWPSRVISRSPACPTLACKSLCTLAFLRPQSWFMSRTTSLTLIL